jgi:hypothetical protein
VKGELPEGFDDAKGGRLGDLDVVNECIDSTMGRIHVCLMCCLSVTIRGLVGSYTSYLKGHDRTLKIP